MTGIPGGPDSSDPASALLALLATLEPALSPEAVLGALDQAAARPDGRRRPGGVEHVEPAGVVVTMMGRRECANTVGTAPGGGDIEDVDADVCGQMPLFASAEAAQGWLADHPGGGVFPIRQAWDLRFLRDWRDRMTALLGLGH